jgi:hypothetical protein
MIIIILIKRFSSGPYRENPGSDENGSTYLEIKI